MCLSAELQVPPRILIIEDDLATLDMLTQLLTFTGYAVVGTATGRDAVAYLAHPPRPPVDLLLLDFLLPDMTGREICAVQRQAVGWQTVPILLMTVVLHYAALARELNVSAIGKPFEVADFLDVVATVIRTRTATVYRPRL